MEETHNISRYQENQQYEYCSEGIPAGEVTE
jgi:hypothetical protein